MKIKWTLLVGMFLTLVGWKAGDKADIEWNGVWYRGHIKSADPQKPGAFCVHYEGWDASSDECGIESSRLAPLGSKAAENTGPAASSGAGGGGGSGAGSYQYDYCGGKPKSSCTTDRGCKWSGSKCVKN